MKQYIRKADIFLLIALLALGLAASGILAWAGADPGDDSKVVIKSGGEIYASYSISEDKTIEVPAPSSAKDGADDYNIVIIKDGQVTVSEASCKNQICVRHGSISRPGESIVCLPNRLIVSIEGGSEGGGYDSVSS